MRTTSIAATAFLAGIALARAPQMAGAAAPVPAAVTDVAGLGPSDYSSPNPKLPGFVVKLLAATDSTTFYAQTGLTVAKHTHATSNEFQVVVAGTGTEWLGDKQVPIKPGSFVSIPTNTVHGGFTGGPFTIVSIKTPPQDPNDFHPAP